MSNPHDRPGHGHAPWEDPAFGQEPEENPSVSSLEETHIFVPDPRTPGGVVYGHPGGSGQKMYPPFIEREIDLNEAMRGQGVPELHHVFHHVHHQITEGNAWFTVGRRTIPTNAPVLVVPANPQRTRLTIVNTDSVNSVELGAKDNIVSGGANSFPLGAGASLDHHHNREVWAIATTASVVIGFKAEFAERKDEQ